VQVIQNDARFATENAEFCLKLPYTTNSNICGKKLTVKHALGGLDGILEKLRSFIAGPDYLLVLDIIPYFILQPWILDNSEAKVNYLKIVFIK
jgi:hypothetical protein